MKASGLLISASLLYWRSLRLGVTVLLQSTHTSHNETSVGRFYEFAQLVHLFPWVRTFSGFVSHTQQCRCNCLNPSGVGMDNSSYWHTFGTAATTLHAPAKSPFLPSKTGGSITFEPCGLAISSRPLPLRQSVALSACPASEPQLEPPKRAAPLWSTRFTRDSWHRLSR